jgi:hypothetical protein
MLTVQVKVDQIYKNDTQIETDPFAPETSLMLSDLRKN